MSTSDYIARLMGPLLLVVGLGMVLGLWADPDAYLSMLKLFLANASFIFVIGMLALVAGVAIVNAHNLWVADWRVIVTILGWLAIVRGVISLVFPLRLHQMGEAFVSSPTMPMISGIVTLVLGGILTVMGYDLWPQETKPQPAAKRARAKTAPARGTGKRAASKRSAAKKSAPARKARTPRKRS